jgi:hypothetical protein
LNASVGPWNSSSSQCLLVELPQRRHGGVGKPRVSLAAERAQLVLGQAVADDGSMIRTANSA